MIGWCRGCGGGRGESGGFEGLGAGGEYWDGREGYVRMKGERGGRGGGVMKASVSGRVGWGWD